ncbi:hypothetical protein ACWC4J_34760 [Streptomyces sp. NPDC001356]
MTTVTVAAVPAVVLDVVPDVVVTPSVASVVTAVAAVAAVTDGVVGCHRGRRSGGGRCVRVTNVPGQHT